MRIAYDKLFFIYIPSHGSTLRFNEDSTVEAAWTHSSVKQIALSSILLDDSVAKQSQLVVLFTLSSSGLTEESFVILSLLLLEGV